MPTRRRPRWSELSPLLQVRGGGGGRTGRALASAASIDDLRRMARRRAPKGVFEYVDGAAGEERSLERARAAFDSLVFHPRVLRDVDVVDTATTILGQPSALPFVFAPTGYTRMMHTEGESAVAAVAARGGIPYALSTMGTTTIEDIAAIGNGARHWFQLYVWRDRERSESLIRRAAAAGYDTLVLTVDVPVGGDRRRDVRNGLTIPPTLGWRTFLNGATHPAWLYDFLTTEPLSFVSLAGPGHVLAEVAKTFFDPTVTFEDLAFLRSLWPGKVIVKGVQTMADAVALADHGVDGIVLSNHGGRQLDRAATPLDLLASVVAEIGERCEVLIDTGVRSGADIVAAVALGASGVLVGRAYLYGLMAAGERGVQRAFDLLADDVRRTMRLLGVTSIAELTPDYVSR
jgi:L-lactate dehydrogenase (cytochrome)